MDTALIIALSIGAVGVAIVALTAYYEERKRMLDWHHKMMLDAWQQGWDAACEMMEARHER